MTEVKKVKVMQFDDLLERLSIYSTTDQNKILRAYRFAEKAHRGEKRKSGEDYITHPIAVACHAIDAGADANTVCASLLHDVVEDCSEKLCIIARVEYKTKEESEEIVLEMIKDQFGEEVSSIVAGVTNITKTKGDDETERNNANLKKIVESVPQDIRKVVVKFGDRLHNMSTMDSMKPEKQKRKSIETLEVYAPLAYLLGQYDLKCKLEDLSYQYLYPQEYDRVEAILNDHIEKIRPTLDKIEFECWVRLMQNGLNNYNIKKIPKHLYGVRRRLNEISDEISDTNLQFIHDLIAIRILADSVEDCYTIRDILKDSAEKDPDVIVLDEKDRDYIATPKSNLYSALHFTIQVKTKKGYYPIQFQIETREMALRNKYGVFAFWKENIQNEDRLLEMQDIVKKMQFYQQIVDLQEENISSKQYMLELKHDLLTKMIYIHGEEAKSPLVEMPYGSTVVDYAFRTNPENIHRIVQARVNGKCVPLKQKLDSQDKVLIDYVPDGEELIIPIPTLIDSAYTFKAKRVLEKKLNM